MDQSGWRLFGNDLYSCAVKVEVRSILPLLIHLPVICEEWYERSFESVSKDKLARRRRAAFDTDEKDVTKKDVKTHLFASFNSLLQPLWSWNLFHPRSDLPEADHTNRLGWLWVPRKKKRHWCVWHSVSIMGACGMAPGGIFFVIFLICWLSLPKLPSRV